MNRLLIGCWLFTLCGCGRSIGLLPPSTLKADEREFIVAASVVYGEELGPEDPGDDTTDFSDGFPRPALHVLGRLGLNDAVEVHGGVSMLSLGLVAIRLGGRVALLGAGGAEGLGLTLGAELEAATAPEVGEVHLPLQLGYTTGALSYWLAPRITKPLRTDAWLGGGSIGVRYGVVTFELGAKTVLKAEDARYVLGEFGVGYAW